MRSTAGILPRSRHLTAATAAIVLLGVFEIYLFPTHYAGFEVLPHLENGLFIAPIKATVTATAAFLLCGIFIYYALKAPYWLRPVYFLLFVLGTLVEYGYQSNFSRFTIFEDLANILFAADSRIFAESAATYFTPAAIVPIAALGVLLIVVRPARDESPRAALVFLPIFFAFFTVSAYVTSSLYPTPAFAALYRTLTGFPVSWYLGSRSQPSLSTLYSTPRETVGYASANAPGNNIVLIVDESIRADHLGINGYARPTTPFLDELNRRGLITNWGIAVSATTCSINSNNILLTGIAELPDVNGRVFRAPTLFQYARAMGYKIHYYDGQTSFRWLGKSNDLGPGDQVVWSHDLQPEGQLYDTDAEIARRVRETVENSTGNFIWINKFGVHPPYRNSYPRSAARWVPVPNDSLFSLGQRNREETVNDYDNALLYNSQSFFSNLVGEEPPVKTFYMYTSDHGQNLGEDGRSLTHCSNTRYEAIVPLFVIGPAVLDSADTGYKASHTNIFATVLDMMSVPKENRGRYAPSLLEAKAGDTVPRTYFEGNLNSRFGNSLNRFDP